MERNILLNEKLLALKSTLPPVILAKHFNLRPDMAARYTTHQKDNFQKDVAWILSFLAESVNLGQLVLFEEFISWLKTFLTSVHVPMKDVAESIELIREEINNRCTVEENQIINPFLTRAVAILLADEQIISMPAMGNNLTELAQHYIDSLLKGDRNTALALVMNKVKTGTTVKEIYTNVFQPVQYEIGRLWQTNKISVAQEHFCTAATQLVMSQLYPYMFTGERKNRKMVMTCVPGELHEMGARMVTDFFEMNGWDTYYLGANMPTESVVKYIIELQPQCIAISATMTYHVSAVADMIHKIKSTPNISPDLKIMVGGYPFKVANGLWQSIGANAFATDATNAISLANTLITA